MRKNTNGHRLYTLTSDTYKLGMHVDCSPVCARVRVHACVQCGAVRFTEVYEHVKHACYKCCELLHDNWQAEVVA